MKPASITTIFLALLLTACGGLLRNEDVLDRTYVLRAAPAAGSPVIPGVLSVLRPTVQPGFDNDRILLTREGQELDQFAASRWGESLPRVVTALAVESLAGGGGFTHVIEAGRAAVASDYELLLTVRHFEAAYAAGGAPPVVQVAFECALTAGTPRRILGRCDAAASEPAAEDRMSAIVSAMERAAQRALAEVRAEAVAAAGMAGK